MAITFQKTHLKTIGTSEITGKVDSEAEAEEAIGAEADLIITIERTGTEKGSKIRLHEAIDMEITIKTTDKRQNMKRTLTIIMAAMA
jgi:hypothetical protein